MNNSPQLIVKEISDPYVRENFKRLNDFLSDDPWSFMALEFLSAQTNAKIPHGLGFKPLDVMQTSLIGAGVTVTFNYDLFDTETIDITVSGACSIRFFIGAYRLKGDSQ